MLFLAYAAFLSLDNASVDQMITFLSLDFFCGHLFEIWMHISKKTGKHGVSRKKERILGFRDSSQIILREHPRTKYPQVGQIIAVQRFLHIEALIDE